MMLRVAVLAALLAYAAAYETEEEVIIGTDANFKDLISEFEFALVEFYAPWCGHCKQLAPEYAKAAQQLKAKDSPVKLIKIDATEQTKLAEEFEIGGYPTLKFFVSGEASEYGGGRSAADIVGWVTKKSGPPAAAVATAEDAQKLAADNEVFVLGVFASEDSDEAKAFVAAAAASELPFGISTEASVGAAYEVTAPAVVVLKQFDEPKVVFDGEFTAAAIGKFAAGNSLPLVIEFTDEAAPKIFGGDIKKHCILFVKKDADNFDELKSNMAATAEAFKGDALFIYIDAAVEANGRILEFFGLSEDNVPAVRLINIETDMAKYAPADDKLDAESLKAFVQGVLDGKIKQHLMAEPVPEDWDAEPVKVLTGGNFEEVALNADTFAFVEFYAPWCGHCKQLAPIWDQLGDKVEKKSEGKVIIAKMDSTANEVEGISIQGFPTLKFFPNANVADAIDYSGARTLAGFAEFIKEQTGVEIDVEEAEEGHDEL